MEEKVIKCGQCALWHPQSQMCRIWKTIRSKNDFCSEATTKLEKCDLCGREMSAKSAIISIGLDHKSHIICQDCEEHYYSCSKCGQASQCDFETSSIDLPKQIQKQVQTAQGYIVANIMNPERVRQTCEKGCKCFDKEFGCSRQNNYCSNFWIKWRM